MKYKTAHTIFKLLDVLFFQKSLPGIPVLMYHAIGNEQSRLCVTVNSLQRQMAFLAERGFRSILPQELAAARPGEKVVLITFDDGFTSVGSAALPVMEQYGFKATVFVATDFIGATSSYARRGADQKHHVMSEGDLQKLATYGWCIANHFASHVNLTELSADEVREEYRRASERLAQAGLGKYHDIVAYPFNRYSHDVMRILKKAGVRLAFNGGNRLHIAADSRLAISRIEVDNNFTRFKLNFSPSLNHAKHYVR